MGDMETEWRQKWESEEDYSFVYSYDRKQEIVGAQPLKHNINKQYLSYIRPICNGENTGLTKKMMSTKVTRPLYKDLIFTWHVSWSKLKIANDSVKEKVCRVGAEMYYFISIMMET